MWPTGRGPIRVAPRRPHSCEKNTSTRRFRALTHCFQIGPELLARLWTALGGRVRRRQRTDRRTTAGASRVADPCPCQLRSGLEPTA
ncbi:hypothetical protein DB30_04296 [Enhygromyxa salina]|uniref:Uncharacterized protein n=1 Tax=Enhygromyxa salina TaxID=215803 RepID=A0A0C2D9M9_9BACT|nr:hypothetical protein DB30_04296 [Enhygromyxa salina]